jgi:phosphatidylinositol alpha-mannosyltransferase
LLGHQPVVLTSSIRGEIAERFPRVIRLGRSLPVPYNGSLSRISLGWQLGSRLDEVLEREEFDLLHIHNPLMPTLPLLALSRARCPLVATFHSYYRRDLLTQIFRPQLGRLLERLDARVPVSASARRAVKDIFPGEYHVIPNGVDVEFFAHASRRNGDRRGEHPRRLRILFVGALVPRKGLPHLLKAFTALCRQRRDVELVVVGDGPERRRLERSLPESVRSAVRFTGFVSRRSLAKQYAEADVFCAPSLGSESFGMVLLEAMASGLPLVAYDIEGYRDVVCHGREGLLIARKDTGAMADALAYFLDNPNERVRFGLRGRQRARRYSWREITRQLASLYHDVLGVHQSDAEACAVPLPTSHLSRTSPPLPAAPARARVESGR